MALMARAKKAWTLGIIAGRAPSGGRDRRGPASAGPRVRHEQHAPAEEEGPRDGPGDVAPSTVCLGVGPEAHPRDHVEDRVRAGADRPEEADHDETLRDEAERVEHSRAIGSGGVDAS